MSMNFAKLGNATWSEPGQNPKSSDAISGFLSDVTQGKLTNSVGDLLQVTRSRTQRQFLSPKMALSPVGGLSVSASAPNLSPTRSAGGAATPHEHVTTAKRLPISPLRKPPLGVSYTVQERPANRVEISSLETELDERVRAVFDCIKADLDAVETGDLYQPHKDSVFLVRDRIFSEFSVDKTSLEKEPWLDRLIKCESLIVVCDSVSSRLVDMLSVSSTQLGNVLRKLRHTYSQSFDQMRIGWKHLRSQLIKSEEELVRDEELLKKLRQELREKEREVRLKVDGELHQLTHEFSVERARDKEKLASTEFKMEQMSETLRSLNGIFKAMQSDGGAARTSDLVSRNQRLEKENAELLAQCIKLDKIKAELLEAQTRLATIEADLHSKDTEMLNLKTQIARRDETITGLMERESLRNAEIEKLKLFTKIQQEQEEEQESFKEQSTSVLCIKCKKSLDDLSNIRAAVLGGMRTDDNKMPCEHYRALLPNLRGRKPNRSSAWLRSVMRAILFSKMREDVNLSTIKGDICKFPQFVYAWFERNLDGLSGSRLTAALAQADDDRWGLYYGCKAWAKDDPEAMIFWALLNEDYNDDGLQFVCHCLSVVFSLGGAELWAQFGVRVLTRNGNISALFPPGSVESGGQIRPHIWLDHESAKQAVTVILARALKVHVVEALDAVEALKVIPEIEEPEVDDPEGTGSSEEPSAAAIAAANAKLASAATKKEPTHISLFMWLRLMLQQLNAEQIHRKAAVDLMFETASVGALTPQIQSRSANESSEQGNQVRFPQFYSICKTLFPNISTLDVASLYTQCYQEGHRKVTADVFTRVADRKGLFARALRLSPLPLLAQHAPITDGIPEMDPSVPISTELSTDIPSYLMSDATLGMSQEQFLRIRLGSLIHRKLAAIKPDILYLMNNVPERWKVLLQEALDVVQVSLVESYQFIARSRFESMADNTKSRKHIDGIQPFVHYRRLLSLASLVKGLTDNPLLPTELFATRHRNVLPNIHISLCQVDAMLSHMEHALILGSDFTSSANSRFLRFEKARTSLVSRKIQHMFRHFVHACDNLVPRPVRLAMRPGYLRGRNGLKKREVMLLPWAVQEVMSGILAVKLGYDHKACIVGLPPLPLEQAVMTFHYLRWGSIDVAERAIHDFYYSVHSYTHGAPRLRLFCAFLGQDSSQDEAVLDIIKMPHALSLYLNLLMEIHRERYVEKLKRDYELNVAEKSANDLSEVSALGIIVDGDGDVTKVQPSSAAGGWRSKGSQLLNSVASIPTVEILFPQTFSGLERTDKKDVWNEDIALCKRAVIRWGKNIRGFDSVTVQSIADLAEKLRKAPNGEIDVDELLWLVMIQWAKYMAWYIKRSSLRAQWNEKNSVPSKFQSTVDPVEIREDTATVDKVKNELRKKRRQLRLSSSYLAALSESIYKPGDGSRLVDPVCIGAFFTKSLSTDSLSLRSAYKSSVHVMEHYLRNSAMWDLNTGAGIIASESTTNQQLRHAAAASAGTTGGDGKHRGSFGRGSFLSKLSAGGEGGEEQLDPALRFITAKHILTHASPDIQVAAAAIALEAYHESLNNLVGRAEEKIAVNPDSDIQRKVLHLRRLIIMLGDVLQADKDFRIQNQTATLDKSESNHAVLRMVNMSKDAWTYVQQIISDGDELAVMLDEDFPQDNHPAHKRVVLDRSYVYNILTKAVLE